MQQCFSLIKKVFQFIASFRHRTVLPFSVRSSMVSESDSRRIRYSSRRILIRSYEREASGDKMEKVAFDVVVLVRTWVIPVRMCLWSCTGTHPRLAVESSGLDSRVHRERTHTLPEGSMLKHRHHLVKHSHNISLVAFLGI